MTYDTEHPLAGLVEEQDRVHDAIKTYVYPRVERILDLLNVRYDTVESVSARTRTDTKQDHQCVPGPYMCVESEYFAHGEFGGSFTYFPLRWLDLDDNVGTNEQPSELQAAVADFLTLRATAEAERRKREQQDRAERTRQIDLATLARLKEKYESATESA